LTAGWQCDYINRDRVSYTEDGQTGSRGIGISVRGIGTLVSGENAFINTIGVYLDEFSVVSVPNQVANPELPDMERVEILRGPQGTYFGLIGLELPKAPEISASLAGEYRWPIAANEAWLRLEYVHLEGQYSDSKGLTNQQTTGPSPAQGIVRALLFGEFPYLSPDFDVVNLRVGFDMASWYFNAYVQNLFEEEYYTGTQENFGVSRRESRVRH
jgi:outer membrane receptor protein involved in Fe transport